MNKQLKIALSFLMMGALIATVSACGSKTDKPAESAQASADAGQAAETETAEQEPFVTVAPDPTATPLLVADNDEKQIQGSLELLKERNPDLFAEAEADKAKILAWDIIAADSFTEIKGFSIISGLQSFSGDQEDIKSLCVVPLKSWDKNIESSVRFGFNEAGELILAWTQATDGMRTFALGLDSTKETIAQRVKDAEAGVLK